MKRKTNENKKKLARLYHLSPNTVKQIDVLAALYGGKEAAVTGAIDATYRAAEAALKKMRVKVSVPTPRKSRTTAEGG